MIRVFTFLVLSIALVSVGCARTPGGVSPSNIPLDQNGYTVLGPVSASDCKVDLLGLIPVSGGNNLADALEEAQGDRGAHALINISVEAVNKYFILWSQQCTNVQATAVTLK